VLAVNQEIFIDVEPDPTSVCLGGTAVFTVEASGTGLTYTWRRGSTPLTDDGGRITGINSPTLTINNATALDNATNYNVLITSPGGACQQAISRNVRLIVHPVPVVTATPASRTICSGGNTSIALSGSPTGRTFSWTVVEAGVTGA